MKLTVPILVAAAVFSGHGIAIATPHSAHLHYMVGVRAQAATRHAAMLHQEAADPALDLTLARENAIEMSRLAGEIGDWLIRIAAAQIPEELAQIKAEIAAMDESARAARVLSDQLLSKLDETLEANSATTPAAAPELFRHQIGSASRQLFARFQATLKAHKEAEQKLGIPVPPDPPAPESVTPAAPTR